VKLKLAMYYMTKKLYVQYQPIALTKWQLEEIQRKFDTNANQSMVVPFEELHVTVLHFGWFEETFKQLIELQPNLQHDTYEDAALELIKKLKLQVPRYCTLTITGAAAFGATGNVLVVTLQADQALKNAYQMTMDSLQEFGHIIGVDNIMDTQPRARALQIRQTLTPHLSLLKGFQGEIHESSIAPYLGKELSFEISPLD
jgi:hypothetical protein